MERGWATVTRGIGKGLAQRWPSWAHGGQGGQPTQITNWQHDRIQRTLVRRVASTAARLNGRKHRLRSVSLDLLSGKRQDSNMGALGVVLQTLEWSWRPLGQSWRSVGRYRGGLGGLLGALGTVLEASWALLDVSWTLLGRSWRCLGRSWACLERSWGALGDSLAGPDGQHATRREPKRLHHRLPEASRTQTRFL